MITTRIVFHSMEFFVSGRSSQRKGKVGEYAVRDYFRSLGYKADRVPSSGAAEGFKGDVKVSDPNTGEYFLVEVKSRKDTFKSVYDLYDELIHVHNSGNFSYNYQCVAMSLNFKDLIESNRLYHVIPVGSRTINKILNMQKLLKGCQYLVVKDNNKPLLFIQYE